MAEYFPLPPSIDNSPSVNAPSAKVVSENPMNAISGTRPAGSLLPGESYKIYNARDVLGALPVDFEVVVGRAAQWTGVGEDYICRVVEYFERRLKRWWIRKQKGAEEAGDSTNSEDSEQDDDELQ